jgi:NAD(P)-dependent dehydrogenase (short-subunit alcohol dehydrogenase family)
MGEFEPTGKVALTTGASRGLGKGGCLAFVVAALLG